jgi:predicted small lipoprotein YifL
MKKYFIVFLSIVMMISICACGGKNSVKFEPKLNKAFTVNAQIKYDGQDSQATIKRLGKANWDVEFSSPDTLSGVLLSYRDDNVEASYKGLSFSVPKSALPLKSIISSLITVIDEAAEKPEITGEEKDGIINVEGENQQGKYTLKMDKSGNLVGFVMPNLNLEITFTDFQENGLGMTETTQTTETTFNEEVTTNVETSTEETTTVTSEE